ncbi:Leucyl/phenylalanyl-tRNA--protein transferase [Geodia barretti]|nr:Leucyl/phenylalanyl-tRNA--protein transferase [Geodia barretti]
MAEGKAERDVFWVDPETRGVIPLDGFHVPRRLARTVRAGRFRITVDRDFPRVVRGCARRTGAPARILDQRAHLRGLLRAAPAGARPQRGGLARRYVGRRPLWRGTGCRVLRREHVQRRAGCQQGRTRASGRTPEGGRLHPAGYPVRHPAPQPLRRGRDAARPLPFAARRCAPAPRDLLSVRLLRCSVFRCRRRLGTGEHPDVVDWVLERRETRRGREHPTRIEAHRALIVLYLVDLKEGHVLRRLFGRRRVTGAHNDAERSETDRPVERRFQPGGPCHHLVQRLEHREPALGRGGSRAIDQGRPERCTRDQEKKTDPHLLRAECELADQLLEQERGLGVRDAAAVGDQSLLGARLEVDELAAEQAVADHCRRGIQRKLDRLVDAHAEHGAVGLGLECALDHAADLDTADAHIGPVGDAVNTVERGAHLVAAHRGNAAPGIGEDDEADGHRQHHCTQQGLDKAPRHGDFLPCFYAEDCCLAPPWQGRLESQFDTVHTVSGTNSG